MATKRPFDPKSFLAKVGEGRTISKYRKDDVVFSQGDPADAVFYIQKGKVKVTVVSDQGKEAVVAILGADEFCGEGCLAGQPRRIATVSAMTECTVTRLEKTRIVRLLHDQPEFSEVFISHLLALTTRVEADLVVAEAVVRLDKAGPQCETDAGRCGSRSDPFQCVRDGRAIEPVRIAA